MNVSSSNVAGDQYLGGLFIYLFQTIREHLFLTVLLPLVAMAITYVAAQQLPTVYTAQGIIRIGMVDGVKGVNPTAAVSRINSPSFKQRADQATNSAGDGKQPAQLSNLTARQETDDTVAVSVRAATAEQARDAITAAVKLLKEEQRRMLGPMEDDLKEQLSASEATIASLVQTRESLLALAKENSTGASADPAFAALLRVWLSDLVSRNEERLADAKAERHKLRARLGARTYPTALLDEPYISPGFAAVRPVALVIFVGGGVFLVSLLAALFRRSTGRIPI